jgi:hypothetical protein
VLPHRRHLGFRQVRQRAAEGFDLVVQLRGQLAERVAALGFLGVDLLAELVEVAGAQGGDFVNDPGASCGE